MTESEPAPERLRRLVDLVARLRAPDGCPWDREQRVADLRAYLLEEAHELAAAIDEGDWGEISEELGDLLFMMAFVARLAEEEGAFRMEEVADRAEAKMISRHPHVFGDVELADVKAVKDEWQRRKLRDPKRDPDRSLLAGVARSLPALVAAYRMTQKAAGVGFDWPDAGAVIGKIEEELAELKEAIDGADRGGDREEIARETGDLLFTVANLARHLGVDPEAALAGTNRKFRTRFAHMERWLSSDGRSFDEIDLDEMERLWRSAKVAESGPET
jgi:ATP diphosphatase